MTDWIELQNKAIQYIYRYNPIGNYALVSLYGIKLDLMYTLSPLLLQNEYGKFNIDSNNPLLLNVGSDQYGLEILETDSIELFSQLTNTYVASGSPTQSSSVTAIAPVVYSGLSEKTQFPIMEAV
jgi:hypothetical protein